MQLAKDEKIIFQGHPSWRAAIAFYIKGLLIVLLVAGITVGLTRGFSDGIQWGWVTVVALIALAIVLLVGFIRRKITTYTVTNERLYIRTGLFSKSEQETRLQRVQNVNTRQSFLERLLTVGDVSFDTAGGDYYDFRFRGVSSPQNVVGAVHRAQREAQEEQRDEGQQAGGL